MYHQIIAPYKAAIYQSYANSEKRTITSSYPGGLLRQYPVLAYSPSGPASLDLVSGQTYLSKSAQYT